MSAADTIPAIDPSAGIGHAATWLLLGALILAALAFLGWSLLHAGTAREMPQPEAADRPRYRCQLGHGRDQCPGRATRLVLTVTTPMYTRLMCDECTKRSVRMGHSVDLGAIDRTTR